jgi:hypothetical protein
MFEVKATQFERRLDCCGELYASGKPAAKIGEEPRFQVEPLIAKSTGVDNRMKN